MMPSAFENKKKKILHQLSEPTESYSDLSPKGSVDEPIRAVIDEINSTAGYVTTSSCSGRISVFLEGKKQDLHDEDAAEELNTPVSASLGGKGGGGLWLFTSHEPVDIPAETSESYFHQLFAMIPKSSRTKPAGHMTRFVHLKFEAMILHVLTESTEKAQYMLSASLASGFRESGAVGLSASSQQECTPMVAVRSAGLGFDSVVGYESSDGRVYSLVDEAYLRILVNLANQRFATNTSRISRFRAALLSQRTNRLPSQDATMGAMSGYEDAVSRRARKRAEGLLRQQALSSRQNEKQASVNNLENSESLVDVDIFNVSH